MEKLKEKLFGLVVILALGVIFVPMLFNDSAPETADLPKNLPPKPNVKAEAKMRKPPALAQLDQSAGKKDIEKNKRMDLPAEQELELAVNSAELVPTPSMKPEQKDSGMLEAKQQNEKGKSKTPPTIAAAPTPKTDPQTAAQNLAQQQAAEQRLSEQRAAAQRLAEQRAAAQRAAEQKAVEQQRLAEQKAAEQRIAAEQKAAEQQRLAAQKVAEQRAAAEQKAVEQQRLAAQKAAEQRAAAEQKAAEQQRLAAQKAAEQQRLAAQKVAEQRAAAEQKAAEQQRLTAQKAAEQKAAEQQRLAEQKVAEQKAAEQQRLVAQKAIEQQRLAEQKAAQEQQGLAEQVTEPTETTQPVTKQAPAQQRKAERLARGKKIEDEDEMEVEDENDFSFSEEEPVESAANTHRRYSRDRIAARTRTVRETPAEVPSRPKAGRQAGWSIQMGTFAQPEKAAALVQKLKAAGYSVYTRKIIRQGKTLTVVTVGTQGSKENAVRLKNNLENRFQVKAILISPGANE